jgi:hypothetical protein
LAKSQSSKSSVAAAAAAAARVVVQEPPEWVVQALVVLHITSSYTPLPTLARQKQSPLVVLGLLGPQVRGGMALLVAMEETLPLGRYSLVMEVWVALPQAHLM